MKAKIYVRRLYAFKEQFYWLFYFYPGSGVPTGFFNSRVERTAQRKNRR